MRKLQVLPNDMLEFLDAPVPYIVSIFSLLCGVTITFRGVIYERGLGDAFYIVVCNGYIVCDSLVSNSYTNELNCTKGKQDRNRKKVLLQILLEQNS